MAIRQVVLEPVQFSDGANQGPNLRRMMEEMRKLQLALNQVIAQANASVIVRDAPGELITLAPGQWAITVTAGSPPVATIRYNDGGTIRTGSLTLA